MTLTLNNINDGHDTTGCLYIAMLDFIDTSTCINARKHLKTENGQLFPLSSSYSFCDLDLFKGHCKVTKNYTHPTPLFY